MQGKNQLFFVYKLFDINLSLVYVQNFARNPGPTVNLKTRSGCFTWCTLKTAFMLLQIQAYTQFKFSI